MFLLQSVVAFQDLPAVIQIGDPSVLRSRCGFTSFCTFHCDVYTCYFDHDETNSLLILKLFCAVSQEPSVFVKLLCGSEGKKGPFLTVYVLQEWLLHIGLLVLSSLC